MKAGSLRDRVLIQNPTRTPSGLGDYIETWPDLDVGVEVWANVEPLSASERFWANSAGATASHNVTMRYTSAVMSTSRLVFEGRLYYVVDPPIDVGGRRREIKFMVQEKVL